MDVLGKSSCTVHVQYILVHGVEKQLPRSWDVAARSLDVELSLGASKF